MRIIDFSNIGLKNSLDVYKKLERDRDTLKKALIQQEQNSLNDSVINLYTYGYHIKDWLKKEKYIGVEEFINNNPELRVCADLCNGSKHKILTSIRSNEDPVQSLNTSEITVDSTAYTADSNIPINSQTFDIKLESGKKYEIMYFANKIVELWYEFIFQNKE
jgi:hypothetical protein